MTNSPAAARRVKTSSDPKVEAMVADPAEYFRRARDAARREARRYVRAHEHRARPA